MTKLRSLERNIGENVLPAFFSANLMLEGRSTPELFSTLNEFKKNNLGQNSLLGFRLKKRYTFLMEIYFVTGNKNKFAEALSIIPSLKQLDIDLTEIQEIDAHLIIEAKLAEGLRHKQGDFIVEDTSLYFDALKGLPGPLIKWFLKTLGNEGLARLANQLDSQKAEAKTIIGYAESSDKIHYFEGAIKGSVVAPRGTTSFGWDSIFQPDGYSKSFAEMSREEKGAISMRRLAFEGLKNYLEKNEL
jgi:inosine triphosphate pyrophosphatase